jgi:hypothetical protein
MRNEVCLAANAPMSVLANRETNGERSLVGTLSCPNQRANSM